MEALWASIPTVLRGLEEIRTWFIARLTTVLVPVPA